MVAPCRIARIPNSKFSLSTLTIKGAEDLVFVCLDLTSSKGSISASRVTITPWAVVKLSAVTFTASTWSIVIPWEVSSSIIKDDSLQGGPTHKTFTGMLVSISYSFKLPLIVAYKDVANHMPNFNYLLYQMVTVIAAKKCRKFASGKSL